MRARPNSPFLFWNKHHAFRFSIGLVLSMTLITTAFEWNFRNDLTDKPLDDLRTNQRLDNPIMEPVVLPTPPRPKVPQNIIAVPDHTPVSTQSKDPEPEPVELITDGPTPDIDELLGGDKPVDTAPVITDYETIPATPKGGEQAFYEYLYKKIKYPSHLQGRGISGKVYVEFEIAENGSIQNVKVLKGFDARLEKEIIRILENAPAWEPAQQGSKKVRTRHVIPFSFNIK